MAFAQRRRTAALALLAAAAAGTALAQNTCNGHAELCSRSYANVSYVGAHNSYSVQSGSLAANQNYDVTTQLDNGIRMLQNQGHPNDGGIHLCHSSCLLLDAGTIQSYLQKVKTWLDENQNEVVTILWVNQDNIPVAQWGAAYDAVGLTSYAYVPPSTPVAFDAWPTLQELVSSGKRLVSFMDYNADYSSVNYILDHFDHFWETPYDTTDNTFPCTIDRGTADTPMYMVNHYLDKNLTFFGNSIPIPDTGNLATTNAATGPSSLGQNARNCAAQHGRYPTFMLVDFYDIKDGTVFQAAASLNGVQYTATQMGNGTAVPYPGTRGNNTSSSSSGNSTTGTSSNSNNSSSGSADQKDAALSLSDSAWGMAATALLALAASVVVIA